MIYLASGCGMNPMDRVGYEEFKAALRAHGLQIYCPWENQRVLGHTTTVLSVGGKNARAIRNCAALIAIVNGADVDSGTASEIGFANALNKPVFAYRHDMRQAGDIPGGKINTQVEYFCNAGIWPSEPGLLSAIRSHPVPFE